MRSSAIAMSLLPSASGLELAMRCSGSVVLPRIDEQSGPEAERGTRIHEAMQKLVKTRCGLEGLEGLADDERTAAAALWDAAPSALTMVDMTGEVGAEVAMAYDLDERTSRSIGTGIGRAYPAMRRAEVYGTADAILLERDTAHVIDWKCGRLHPGIVGSSWQVKALALLVARNFERSAVRISLVWAPPGAERATVDSVMLEALDLDLIECELRELLRRLEDAERDVLEGRAPRLALGPHCARCPARLACPARAGLVRSAVADGAKELTALSAKLASATSEELSSAWARARPLLDAAKEVEAAFRTLAMSRPFETKPGFVLGARVTRREKLEPLSAASALEDILGPVAARVGIDMDVTKAGIDRAIRMRVGGPAKEVHSAAFYRREILGRLRREGAISLHETTSVTEHRAELPPAIEDET